MTSILIVEKAYQTEPEAIAHYYANNAYDKREIEVFKNFIGYTGIVSKGVMSVEQCFVTAGFLAKYTDLVLAHQWECALNYSYYEALFAGFPLVHNSNFLKEEKVGYYYPDFDAYAGLVEQAKKNYLAMAVITHDDHLLKEYKEQTIILPAIKIL